MSVRVLTEKRKAELRETIALLRRLNAEFYGLCFEHGVGSRCHAFIEFNGMHSKFIDMCERLLHQGVDFAYVNGHGSEALPFDAHDVLYLGEKFNCIFGHSMTDPKIRRVFQLAAFGKET